MESSNDLKSFLEGKFQEVGQQLAYNGASLQQVQQEMSAIATRQVRTEAAVQEHGSQIQAQGVTLARHGEQLGNQQIELTDQSDKIRLLEDDILDMRRRTVVVKEGQKIPIRRVEDLQQLTDTPLADILREDPHLQQQNGVHHNDAGFVEN